MAASPAARHSIWPLAGYALLAIAAFIKEPTARSRILYPRREHPIAAFEEERTKDRAPPGKSTGKSTWWSLIRDAGSQWVGHKDARLGAALAYYSVFSIGPLIVIAVAVAGQRGELAPFPLTATG